MKRRKLNSLIMTLIICFSLLSNNPLHAYANELWSWPVPASTEATTYDGHCAIDIPAKGDNLEILATRSGTVVDSQPTLCPHTDQGFGHNCLDGNPHGYGTYGNYIILRHEDDDGTAWYSIYGHLAYNTIRYHVGDYVKQGEVLGYMGSSGASTGQHLHFEVRKSSNSPNSKVEPLLLVTPGVIYRADPQESNISISNESYPTGNRPPGKNFGVYGEIRSNYPLSTVWGGVYYSDGTPTAQTFEDYPRSTYYNLYPYFDSKIIFDDLPEGRFIYRIEAADNQGYSKVLVESTFSVGDATPSNITISDEVYPAKEHPLGKNQLVRGNISSTYPIVRVWGGVYHADGTATEQYRDKSFNSKTVSLYDSFDSEIIFGSLPLGDYIFKFDATDSKGISKEVIRYSFSVVDTLGSDITISGEKYPSGNLPLGGNFGIYGEIKSTYPLVRVWGGVYNWDGSPTEQICDQNPNWASFNIYDKFDPYIIFGALPEGDFIYRIEATDSKDYTKILIESNFTIGNGTPSEMSISGAKYPSGTHPLGKNFGLYGIINSTFPLTRVWGGVYHADGTKTAQYSDQATNSKSFDLYEHFDPVIIFDDVPEGDYIYKIEATDQNGSSKVLIESDFSVVKPPQIYPGEYEKGIDVSEFQDVIDWNAVAESEIQFAVIRAATTNFINAEYMEDKFFQSNYENAKKAGIKVGVYMYSSANTQEEIEQNISSLLKTLGDKKLDLPVFIDVEQASRQTGIGKEALTDVLLYGCSLIKNAGYQAGVYANQDWFANYIDANALQSNDVTIWMAAWPYTNSPADPLCYDYSNQCTLWQYSDKGTVAGISGYVDLDFSYQIYESIQMNKTGDVSGDGKVDTKDAMLLTRYVNGWEGVTLDLDVADLDGDGKVDTKDAMILTRYVNAWEGYEKYII